MVSYILVNNFDTGRFWPETNPNKYCDNAVMMNDVANQVECQIQCLEDDDCMGIVYSHRDDWNLDKFDCYKCPVGPLVLLDSYGITRDGYYAKPGITIVLCERV